MVLGQNVIEIVIRARDEFSNTLSKAQMSFSEFASGARIAGAAITGFGVAGAFAIGSVIKAAGDFEQTNIAFTTMLGNAEEATVLLKDLADFATKTPFTITGVEQSAKQLMAMGIETDKLLPTLKALGDVSAGLSVPLDRIAYNFGQVRSQGKLTGVELRDFTRAGVPLIAELAKNLGVAEDQIKEMVSAGDIGFAEVENAFITMSSEGGKFYDLMDAQSKTFLGQISNVQDSLTKIARVMGDVFLPAAKWVAEQLGVLVGWMEQHPAFSKFAIVVLAVATALALIVGPALLLIGMLPFMIAGFTALSAVTLPLTLTILAIAAAIAVVIAIIMYWKQILHTLVLATVQAAGSMDKAWQWVKDAFIIVWESIKNVFFIVWNAMVSFFQGQINTILSGINMVIKAMNMIPGVNIPLIPKVDLSGIKGEITDIGALSATLAAEREQRAADFAKAGSTFIVNIDKAIGLDEADLSKSLSDELNQKVSL